MKRKEVLSKESADGKRPLLIEFARYCNYQEGLAGMHESSIFTPHAEKQMQKRGILPVEMSFLEKYAERRRASGDAFHYLITKRGVQRAVADGRISPQLADKLVNSVYVVEMVPSIRTAYKQDGGFSAIRKVHKGKLKRRRQEAIPTIFFRVA